MVQAYSYHPVVYFSYSYHPVNRYHVLFYNIERKTFTRVNIVKRLSVVVDTHSSTIWRIWSLYGGPSLIKI